MAGNDGPVTTTHQVGNPSFMLFSLQNNAALPSSHLPATAQRFVFIMIVALVLLAMANAVCIADDCYLDVHNMATNYFGGQITKVKLTLSSKQAFKGKLLWNLMLGSRAIQRDEKSIVIHAHEETDVHIELSLPPVKDDVVSATDINISVVD